MSDIWGYPYRLGITLFLIIGTGLLTVGFLWVALMLEKSFQKDKLKKK